MVHHVRGNIDVRDKDAGLGEGPPRMWASLLEAHIRESSYSFTENSRVAGFLQICCAGDVAVGADVTVDELVVGALAAVEADEAGVFFDVSLFSFFGGSCGATKANPFAVISFNGTFVWSSTKYR